MNRFILILLSACLFNLEVEAAQNHVFLECSECINKSCDAFGDLDGKPAMLLHLWDVPNNKPGINARRSANIYGTSGMGFLTREAEISYSAKHIFLKYEILGEVLPKPSFEHYFIIERASLNYRGVEGEGSCREISRSEHNTKKEEINNILWNQNKILGDK